MSHNISKLLVALTAIVGCGVSPREVEAGPLLDWLFGRRPATAAYAVGQPVPVGNAYGAGYPGSYGTGYAPGTAAPSGPAIAPAPGYAGNYGTYYSTQLPAIGPAGAGYTAPMPSGIIAATLPSAQSPTLSYVPNYQTNSARAPVTYYRPILTTDPNTGAQVVAMAPCTSYEYLAQRSPTLGRSALFGSSAPPVFQPPSPALPTYTLPSGGIPLANNSAPYALPQYSGSAYGSGYGSYSAPQAPVGQYPSTPYRSTQPGTFQPPFGSAIVVGPTSVGPAGAYPTSPLGQSSYYGSQSGGSNGSYSAPSTWQSVPGLVAPQSPSAPVPSTPVPGTLPPNYGPSGGLPSTAAPGEFYPPNNYVPSDPANQSPSLPAFPTSENRPDSGMRPQLRSIVRQPTTPDSPQQNASTNQLDELRQLPAMLPIPVPQDFDREKRWNPGLLREQDLTAMRPVSPQFAQLAGQSKTIQWASFETAQPSSLPTARSGLRPISPTAPSTTGTATTGTATTGTPTTALRPTFPTAGNPNAPVELRKSGGWKASR